MTNRSYDDYYVLLSPWTAIGPFTRDSAYYHAGITLGLNTTDYTVLCESAMYRNFPNINVSKLEQRS